MRLLRQFDAKCAEVLKLKAERDELKSRLALADAVVDAARWLIKYLNLEVKRTGEPMPTLKLADALAKLEGGSCE